MTVIKPLNYYILLVRDYPAKGASNRKWGIEFGSYSKSEVHYERDCFRANYPANCLRIIKTSDLQTDIDAIVKAMNEGE